MIDVWYSDGEAATSPRHSVDVNSLAEGKKLMLSLRGKGKFSIVMYKRESSSKHNKQWFFEKGKITSIKDDYDS
jgi:hypothetical protein